MNQLSRKLIFMCVFMCNGCTTCWCRIALMLTQVSSVLYIEANPRRYGTLGTTLISWALRVLYSCLPHVHVWLACVCNCFTLYCIQLRSLYQPPPAHAFFPTLKLCIHRSIVMFVCLSVIIPNYLFICVCIYQLSMWVNCACAGTALSFSDLSFILDSDHPTLVCMCA